MNLCKFFFITPTITIDGYFSFTFVETESHVDNSVNEGEFFYLHRWDEGNKFEKHIDKRREDSWYLVVGASLNDDYEGGKLLCYNPDIEIASTKGELYKMGAEVLHEVTEITSGTRYSFVYFIKQPLLYPKKQLL